jgi:hypothetical protein
MKGKKRGPYNTNTLFLSSAIAAAIKRCELVCNPAIVRRSRFTIHARRVGEGLARSWVVSYTSNEPPAEGNVTKLRDEDF